jgi:hypothetical protein
MNYFLVFALNAVPAPPSQRIMVYRNGENDSASAVFIIVGDLRIMWEQCTQKLKLNSAARRLYTKDGGQILDVGNLKTVQEVEVTCGEPFKNPQNAKRIEDLKVQLYQEKKALKQLQLLRQDGQTATLKENQLANYVSQLEYHLYEAVEKTEFAPTLAKKMQESERLYPSTDTIYLKCWRNGDDQRASVFVYRYDMDTVLECTTQKLNLGMAGQRVFMIPSGA